MSKPLILGGGTAAPSLEEGAVADRPASPAGPEESVDEVDDWVTELLDRLASPRQIEH